MESHNKNLKKFNIIAHLPLSFPESQLSFKREIKYETTNGLRVKAKDHETDKDKLLINIACDAVNKQEARLLAEDELQRISELLSWEFNVPISNARVISMEQSETKDGELSIFVANTVCLSESYVIRQIPGDPKLKRLEGLLANTLDEEKATLLLMYQQAINMISIPLRFLLLFRILEYIHQLPGKERKARINADKWIRKMKPGVELKKDLNNNDISIYTFLRDNVHPKPNSPKFPIQMYEGHLVAFQELVRKAIHEKIPYKK